MDMNQLMQQAQAMQAQMKKAQDEVTNITVVGEAGAGLVKVTMTGRHDCQQVVLDESLDDRHMIAELVAAAINDATQKLEEATRNKMAEITKGMELPPGFNFPS